ncbi:MAG TPA: indole-3-glycerol phosphate synthase TrpC [Pyrinomonadaceae bacterium]|nr:indole-3-glycerol phosphate synthase TrpC [Pyrinomonadaceae bacterium]
MNPSANFLEEIMERKRVRLEYSRACHPLEIVHARASEIRRKSQHHALRRALEPDGDLKVIAEIKRASPSKGVIKENCEPTELACAYSRGGAVTLSVLTEEDYFRGSLYDLRAVREISPLPILRKDFIVDEYQIYETAEAGADALLLIVAALNDEQLSSFRRITEEELGMDALVEVHTPDEMRRAQRCGATLLGINNRNLRTFEVSLDVSINLARNAPPGALLVSESGLRSAEDLRRLQALGYSGFLIGEALMRAADPTQALQTLMRDAQCKDRVRVKICGITNLKDAQICVAAGADMLGFNFYSGSPRYIAPEDARKIIEQLPSEVMSIGIFVNEGSPENVAGIADVAGVAAIQLHGEETPFYCRALKNRFVIKALRVREGFTPEQISEYETAAILLDAFSAKARGGTGERFDWSFAQQARRLVSKVFLAGGLTPGNVTTAIAAVRPFAVDVCSSVESGPGQKDEDRVREFIAAAKRFARENVVVSE